MNKLTKTREQNTVKATRAKVSIGHLLVDGYRTEDGKFGMSIAGLGKLCGFHRTESTSKIMSNKKVKTLAVKGFEVYKNIACENMKITFIPVDWVPSVIQCLALSGNEHAEEFLLNLAGLSLQQLFCDAFGVKFELAERQAWLETRFAGIEKRNKWTEAIKAYGETHPVSESWKRFIYANVSDRLNLELTGQKSGYWCDKLECTSATLRDHWKPSHLGNIDAIERHASVLCLKGMEPMEALEKAIEFFGLPMNPEPQSTVSKDALRMRKARNSSLPKE